MTLLNKAVVGVLFLASLAVAADPNQDQYPYPWLNSSNWSGAPQVNHDPKIVTVEGHLLAKVIYSNFVTLRTGSVYEMRYLFEQNLGFPRPTFNYTFSDLGLGTAEPLYAMFESGHQGSYEQLIQASSEPHRHLDHFSDMVTPDGCRVQSIYIVRSTAEYPDLYSEQRKEGYNIVDASWDYTTKLFPGAQCGHHRANDPDPNFDPVAAIKPYLEKFRTMDEIPAELIAKYEAKVNLEIELEEKVYNPFQKTNETSYAQRYNLRDNSLWYYQDGHADDYGVNEAHPQPGLQYVSKARDLVLPATQAMAENLTLPQTAVHGEFTKYADFMDGHPTPNYDPTTEPGGDAFSLSQITTQNFLTSGIDVIPVTDPLAVREMVLNPANYRLVSAVVRPNETELDPHFPEGYANIPELRLVYQLVDPKNSERAYDQAYIHLVFDAVDRGADESTRARQAHEFMSRLDQLTEIKQKQPGLADVSTISFIQDTIAARPMQALAFSSTLTGIWVFGRMTRENPGQPLTAERQVRHGIDVGYYSTAYDSLIFAQAANQATGARKVELETLINTLIPNSYRDPRRNDVNQITFNGVTCAQCHQMSARDGVHVKLNDFLDRRITSPVLATEYLYRELDRQLQSTQSK